MEAGVEVHSGCVRGEGIRAHDEERRKQNTPEGEGDLIYAFNIIGGGVNGYLGVSGSVLFAFNQPALPSFLIFDFCAQCGVRHGMGSKSGA